MLQVTKNKIQLTRGDTAILSVSITSPDGTEYTLEEGDIIRFTVRKTPKSGDIFISKTLTEKEIPLSTDDTKHMQFGTYFYDIELTKASGDVDTVIVPTVFEVLEEVTY